MAGLKSKIESDSEGSFWNQEHCHLLAFGYKQCFITSLSLMFLLCKMEILPLYHRIGKSWEIMYGKCSVILSLLNLMHFTSLWLKPVVLKLFTHSGPLYFSSVKAKF